MDEFEQLLESSEREVEGYKESVSNVDDLEAVRNSYKVCFPSFTKLCVNCILYEI